MCMLAQQKFGSPKKRQQNGNCNWPPSTFQSLLHGSSHNSCCDSLGLVFPRFSVFGSWWAAVFGFCAQNIIKCFASCFGCLGGICHNVDGGEKSGKPRVAEPVDNVLSSNKFYFYARTTSKETLGRSENKPEQKPEFRNQESAKSEMGPVPLLTPSTTAQQVGQVSELETPDHPSCRLSELMKWQWT